MPNAFTEQETKAALELYNSVLKRLFAGANAPMGRVDIGEISEVTGAAFASGQYPMINMFMILLGTRNPEIAMIFGVSVTAVVEAIRAGGGGANLTKQ